jgi:hypothetical protein
LKRTGTLLLALFLGVCFASHCGATVYYSDGTAASVQYLNDNSAQDGDTITLPAGTFDWTQGVNITKGVTLQGQTTTDSVAGTAVDNTVILDDLPRPPSRPMIRLSTVLGKSYRITGITFSPATVTALNYNGAVIFNGNSQSVRIDHCHFSPMPAQSTYVQISGPIFGVADHNVLQLSGSSESFVFWADAWPNPDRTPGVWGDGSWAAPTNFGGSEFFFVEDNYIANVSSPFYELAGNTDDSRGGRWVFRHNHCYDIEIATHGTETGRYRGGRAREIYNNDFHYAHAHGTGGIRSGVTITHDNTFDGVQPTHGIELKSFRAFQPDDPLTFGSGTGDNPWDVNDPYGLYDSGTVSSGSGTSLVDTTKNWQTNQWAGFTVKRVSDGNLSFIISNTANALTLAYTSGGYGGGCPIWASGDQYQIHKALVLLDQPGRGQGDLVIGNPPVNSTTGTASWPHEILEASYAWNDVFTPTGATLSFLIGAENALLQQAGRDYFNNTPMPAYAPYIYPHPLVSGQPQPTPTPLPSPTPTPTASGTPSPTATPTPTPSQCQVPNFIGTRENHAQSMWNNAGFTTSVTVMRPRSQFITWQSDPPGFIGSCSGTRIGVQ